VVVAEVNGYTIEPGVNLLGEAFDAIEHQWCAAS